MKDRDFLYSVRSALQTFASTMVQGEDKDGIVTLLVEVQERIYKEKKKALEDTE